MKELSIEEKAKRYDKAIEKLRSLHDNYDTVSTLIDIKKELEEMFPELAESEDERIMKKVIDVLKLNVRGAESQMQASRGVDRTFEVYACNKVIAWLEKGEKGTKGNEREIPIPEPPLTIKHAKEVMGIKQNDTWSEEDEKMYTATIFALAGFMGNKDKLDWLKSLKERYTWKPSGEQIQALEAIIGCVHDNASWEIGTEWFGVLFKLKEQLKKLREE